MKAARFGSLAVLLVAFLWVSLPARGAAPPVVLDMEGTPLFAVGQVDLTGGLKVPAGVMETVAGKVGKAVQFRFAAEARSGYFMAYPKATAAWDQAAGLSFWVKGDGSDGTGAIELRAGEKYRRYAYCFPISSTEWRKVEIPWSVFVPEQTQMPFLGSAEVKPSSIQAIGFGKWYFWGRYPNDYPAVTFAVDQMVLEPTLRVDRADYTPKQPGLPRTVAKLKAKQPLTIVTVGDSLTDKGHWTNREVLWSEVMAKGLEQRWGSKITLVNPAVGGSHLTQGLVIAPRWLQHTPAPDLITICYGYNDMDDGATPAIFGEKLRYVVDALRRATKGKSEILLMTTCPADARWTEMEGLAEAVREVAREKKTGLMDVAAAFHRVGDKDATVRASLYCQDHVHLSPAGHRLLAETAQQAIEGAAKNKGARP